MNVAFNREMRRKYDRAAQAYRDHVADCATYIDGLGHCPECDRLAGVVRGVQQEWNEGPEAERDDR